MAATRIKTVEYTFGSYSGATAPADIASNGFWTPAAITVYLPENGKTIRSAWLEVFTHATAVNASDVQVRFNTGATPATVVDNITAQITNQTGETQILRILADVTSQITTTSPQLYSMDFRVTGPASNSHSAKLFITYEYDDTSATRLRTVRFPLYSAGGTATKTTVSNAGTHGFTYNADLGEGGSATVRQYWFEIHGFQQNDGNTTDATVRAEVSGQAAGNLLAVDMALQTDRWFQYIAPNLPGFSLNTSQTLNVTLSKQVYMLGGELVVTYEAPETAPVKTKTIKYFYGQDISFGGSTYPSRVLSFEEGGFSPKEIYARYTGTLVSNTTVRTITVASSLDGNAVPSAGYQIGREAAAYLSHFTLFHSLTSQIAHLHDGTVIDINHTCGTQFGAIGVELIITYQYSEETNYTISYEVFGGQKDRANTVSFSDDFTTYFPETVTKSTKSVWMDACMFSHTAVADKTTVTGVGSQTAQTVPHQNLSESNYFRYLRQADDQVGVTPNTYTTSQANGTTNTNAAYNFTAKVTYGVQVVVAGANATVTPIAGLYANDGKKTGMFKINIVNEDTVNAAEVAGFQVRLTDGNDAALTAGQAQALFQNIHLYTDNASSGTVGSYDPNFDTSSVGTVTNAQLGNAAVFSNGLLAVNNANGTLSDPDVTPALQLAPGGATYYFLVAELAANAAAQTPNAFDFRLDADGDTVDGGSVTVRRASNNQPLVLDPTANKIAGKVTAVHPADPAPGFTSPDFGAPIETVAVAADDGRVYVAVSNGTIYGINAGTGAVEWSFASSGPIYSTPWADGGQPEVSFSDLYFGNDAGNLYRINGANASPTWTQSFAGLQIRSAPAVDGTSVYIGLSDGRVRKRNMSNGNGTGVINIGAGSPVTSSPSLFSSVSVLYVGVEGAGNSFFSINTGNMSVTNSLNVGQISSSPFTDVDTGYIYFGSRNGVFYARNGSTLASIPGWSDYNTGSSIRSSPFVTTEGGSKFVYFGADNGKLYKLNAATGALVWTFPPGTDALGPIASSPVPDNTTNPAFLTFGSDDGGFYILENLSAPAPTLRTGFPVFTGAQVRSGATINWVTSSGPKQIFVVSRDGKVYRWDIP